jgi:serine/threonine-protein kinase
VLDFGIAKGPALASGDALTATRDIMGSPGYMAPEQLRSTRDVDARADIWALGITLQELVTGKLGPSSSGAGRIHPPAFERVVRQCLEHDPARRFASARELYDALAPFASRGRSRTPRSRSGAMWIPIAAVGSAAVAGAVTWAFMTGRMPASGQRTGAPMTATEAPSAAAAATYESAIPSSTPLPTATEISSANASLSAPIAASSSVPGSSAPRRLVPARRLPPAAPPSSAPAAPSAAPTVDPHGLADRK